MNKLYSVDFKGHYPVGAVAVVKAASKEEALEIFTRHLAKVEPYLSAKGCDITELPFNSDNCYILLNGNY